MLAVAMTRPRSSKNVRSLSGTLAFAHPGPLAVSPMPISSGPPLHLAAAAGARSKAGHPEGADLR
eukprot:4201525-Alexandrium_andersonii.AAC.1